MLAFKGMKAKPSRYTSRFSPETAFFRGLAWPVSIDPIPVSCSRFEWSPFNFKHPSLCSFSPLFSFHYGLKAMHQLSRPWEKRWSTSVWCFMLLWSIWPVFAAVICRFSSSLCSLGAHRVWSHDLEQPDFSRHTVWLFTLQHHLQKLVSVSAAFRSC